MIKDDMRFKRIFVILVIICTFCLQGQCEEAGSRKKRMKEILDATHEQISSTLYNFADAVDRFFVDNRFPEEENLSSLRVRTWLKLAEGGRSAFKQRVGLNLRFPKLERRFRLMFESFTEDDKLGDLKNVQEDQKEENDKFATTMRYIIKETRTGRLSLDGGMGFRPEPDPFVRIRWGRDLNYEKWSFYPSVHLIWKRFDGFGETTGLDIERLLAENKLARWRGEFTWSETSLGIDFWNSLAYSVAVTDLSGYAVSIGAGGHTRPYTMIDSFHLTFTYRRAVYKDWIYVQVTPALDFFRDREYAVSPAISVQLEGIFRQED